MKTTDTTKRAMKGALPQAKVRFRTVKIGRKRVCIPSVDTRGLPLAAMMKRAGTTPRPAAAATELARRQVGMTPLERKVMNFRLGVKEGYSRTLRETCKQFSLTAAEVRRIEQKMTHHAIHPCP